MKLIPSITQEPTDNIIISDLLKDVMVLNNQINEYKLARKNPKGPDPLEILFEIYQFYLHVMEKYPQINLCDCPDFAPIFQDNLYKQFQKEFQKYNITSLEQSALAEQDLKHIRLKHEEEHYWEQMIAQPLPLDASIIEFIKNMAKEDNPRTMFLELKQLKRLLRLQTVNSRPADLKVLRNLICAANSKMTELKNKHPKQIDQVLIKPSEFSKSIANMDPDLLSRFTNALLKFASTQSPQQLTQMALHAELQTLSNDQEYQDLLASYSIKFVGGYNSKNFEIQYIQGGASQILKIENRLDSSKTLANKLADSALAGTLTTTFADRLVLCTDPVSNQEMHRNVIVSEYCSGGDIESLSYRTKHDIPGKTSTALILFKQMSKTLLQLQAAKTGFPDQKLQNWLVESDSSLKIKIDDKKSFEPVGDNGLINKSEMSDEYYYQVYSSHMFAPETSSQNEFHVDKMHSYLLGKNLYHFLTNCSHDYLESKMDASHLDFNSYPIFNTPEGAYFKQLIQKLVVLDPAKRTMSMKEVADELTQHDKNYAPDDVAQLIAIVKQLDNAKGLEIEIAYAKIQHKGVHAIRQFRYLVRSLAEQLDKPNLITECLEMADQLYECDANPKTPKQEYTQKYILSPQLQYYQLVDTQHALMNKLSNNLTDAQLTLENLISECNTLSQNTTENNAKLSENQQVPGLKQLTEDYEHYKGKQNLDRFKHISIQDRVEMKELLQVIKDLKQYQSEFNQKLYAIHNVKKTQLLKPQLMTLQVACLKIVDELFDTTQFPEREQDKQDFIKAHINNPNTNLTALRTIKMTLDIRLKAHREQTAEQGMAVERKQLIEQIQVVYTKIEEFRPLTKSEEHNKHNILSEKNIDRIHNSLQLLELELKKTLKNKSSEMIHKIRAMYPHHAHELYEYETSIDKCDHIQILEKMNQKLGEIFNNITIINEKITAAEPEQADKLKNAVAHVRFHLLDKVFSKDNKIHNKELIALQALVAATSHTEKYKSNINVFSNTDTEKISTSVKSK